MFQRQRPLAELFALPRVRGGHQRATLAAGACLLTVVTLAACSYDHDGAPSPVSASVRVEAEGCSTRAQVGGGSFVGHHRVVTVAHVVAGSTDVDVVLSDGTEKTATVVALDRHKDLALLAVDADIEPLPLGAMRAGSHGEFVSWRSGGPRPLDFLATEVVDIRSSDIDHSSTDLRRGYGIEANVLAGDSGSVLVSSGHAVAVVFARSAQSRNAGWATSIDEVRTMLDMGNETPVDLGECPTHP